MNKTIDFDNVADIYDAYVNVDFDIDFYLDYCKSHEYILELMCGTGRVSVPLIQAGFNMTCVDYAQEMLNVFRSKLPVTDQTPILCQDITDLCLERQYDLAFIPFNSIAEITDVNKRKQAVQKIYEHLLPGGIFFCTLYNPDYRKKSADGNLKCLGKYDLCNDRKLLVTYYNQHSPAEQIIHGTQFYEIYDNSHKLVEKRFMDIRFALIEKEEMLSVAKDAGFKLQNIYGDYQGNPFHSDSTFMNFEFVKTDIK